MSSELPTTKPVIHKDERVKFLGVGVAWTEFEKENGDVVQDFIGIRTDLGFVGPREKLLNAYEMMLLVKEAVDQILADPATKLWSIGSGYTKN